MGGGITFAGKCWGSVLRTRTFVFCVPVLFRLFVLCASLLIGAFVLWFLWVVRVVRMLFLLLPTLFPYLRPLLVSRHRIHRAYPDPLLGTLVDYQIRIPSILVPRSFFPFAISH